MTMRDPQIMVKRVAAAQATLDHFRDKPFAWGQCDCAVMGAYHLRQLGITTPLRSFGTYSTARGAKKALLAKGYRTIAEALDGMGLKRIPHSMMLVGDFAGLPAPNDDVALSILMHPGKFFGFHEQSETPLLMYPDQRQQIVAAWRVI